MNLTLILFISTFILASLLLGSFISLGMCIRENTRLRKDNDALNAQLLGQNANKEMLQ